MQGLLPSQVRLVVEGASSLNESALTGEPMPVAVSAGADFLILETTP